MNKFITVKMTSNFITVLLCAMLLSSCALFSKGIVIPTPIEMVRG